MTKIDFYFSQEIHGIWFYEETNCQKLFQMMNQVINKLKNSPKKEVMGQGFKQAAPGVKVGSGRIGGVSNNGEISLADLLNNAGNKEYVGVSYFFRHSEMKKNRKN